MEPEILSAGVTATVPVISGSYPHSIGSAKVYNDRDKPIKLRFRYYWYDKKGLGIYPKRAEKSVEIHAHCARVIRSEANSFMATQARLYLYL